MNSPHHEEPTARELSDLAPEFANALAAVTNDIAVVIDAEGVVQHVAPGAVLIDPGARDWVGRRWVDTVTGETRRKVEQLLSEAATAGVSRRREVNHLAPSGNGVPVNYATVRLGATGPFVAAGRDMRAVSAIQQRLVETQQEVEREYWKRRQADSRYRLLFQVATDAVLVVDAHTMQVVDANRLASRWLGLDRTSLLGTSVLGGFDRRSQAGLEELLSAARASGRPGELRAQLIGHPDTLVVSAMPMRSEQRMQLVVRLRADGASAAAVPSGESLAHWVENTPDAVAVTDPRGQVLMCNRAFSDLCRVAGDADVLGQRIGDWLSDGSDALADTLGKVRQHGIVAESRATLRAGTSADLSVEFAAALLTEGDQERIGFTLSALPAIGVVAQDGGLAAGLAGLDAAVGQRDLPQLMREASQLVERHFVGLALDRAGGDNRLAASSLGISAESLELRRLRLGLHRPQTIGDGVPPVQR